MATYLLKRTLLIIPTLFGIMLISFGIIQFAPGGPVERVIAQISGTDVSATARIGGSQGDTLSPTAQSQAGQNEVSSKYRGAQGLDPEFIKQLEKQFGFDKPTHERFFLMMKSYLLFDFGRSYFRDVSVLQLIKEKLPVSVSLGVWMLLITYLVSIPLGIRKAVHDGERFDTWTSGVLVLGYAGLPGRGVSARRICRRIVRAVVSAARSHLRQLASAFAVRQGRRLLLASDAAAHCHVAGRLHDHDVPDPQLLPR
jgi:microcin C transport system permease protein